MICTALFQISVGGAKISNNTYYMIACLMLSLNISTLKLPITNCISHLNFKLENKAKADFPDNLSYFYSLITLIAALIVPNFQ